MKDASLLGDLSVLGDSCSSSSTGTSFSLVPSSPDSSGAVTCSSSLSTAGKSSLSSVIIVSHVTLNFSF